ncbi:hypothetical protein LDENG_00293840 [Lucifuga dentata]|nr:hypothetical protein LDENG_00293840 [Lucifuga dentata]
MLTPYEPVCSLISSGGTLLAVPKSRLKSKGDRAFAIRALLLWNDLPEEIMLADSVSSFKSLLKTPFIDLLLCDVILKLSFFLLLLSYLYLLFIYTYMFIYCCFIGFCLFCFYFLPIPLFIICVLVLLVA